jgi:hypothetical protein
MGGLDWNNTNEVALFEENKVIIQENNEIIQNVVIIPSNNENPAKTDLDQEQDEKKCIPSDYSKIACEPLQITYYTQDTQISPIDNEDDIQAIFRISQPLPSKTLQFSSETSKMIEENHLNCISDTVPINLEDENLFLPLSFQEFGYTAQCDK